MTQAQPERFRHGLRYAAWLAGSWAGILLILAIVSLAFLFWRKETSYNLDHMVRIEPNTVRFEGKTFAEGDIVRGQFRLTNTSRRPLSIDTLRTSCSCVASVAEAGRTPPFVVGPSSSTEITLTTTALSIQGLEQSYTAAVQASLDGRRLPDYHVAMTFHVADSLKADPAVLRIYEAPDDSPTRRSIVFYTYNDTREVPEPKVRVTGFERLRADLRRSPAGRDDKGRILSRFTLDVSIEPPSDDLEFVAGQIEVAPEGQPPITIPVACTFRRAFRIEPRAVKASGKPGESVERVLYQEFSADEWRDIELVSKPDGCEVQIKSFDNHTNSIHVKAQVRADKEIASRNDFIVLAPRGRSRTVRVPIHYSIEE